MNWSPHIAILVAFAVISADFAARYFFATSYATLAIPYWRFSTKTSFVVKDREKIILPEFGPFPRLELTQLAGGNLMMKQRLLEFASIWYLPPSFAVLDVSTSLKCARVTLKLQYWVLLLPLAIYSSVSDQFSSTFEPLAIGAISVLLIALHTFRLLSYSKLVLTHKEK